MEIIGSDDIDGCDDDIDVKIKMSVVMSSSARTGLARAPTAVSLNVQPNLSKQLEPFDTPTKWTPRLQEFMKNSQQSIR